MIVSLFLLLLFAYLVVRRFVGVFCLLFVCFGFVCICYMIW